MKDALVKFSLEVRLKYRSACRGGEDVLGSDVRPDAVPVEDHEVADDLAESSLQGALARGDAEGLTGLSPTATGISTQATSQRYAAAGVQLHVLQALMDHRSADTTSAYYQVSKKMKREAVDGTQRRERKAGATASLTTDLELTRAELWKVRDERDRLKAKVQRGLGQQVDQTGSAELVTRIKMN